MLAITPKAREMLDSFAEQADQADLSLRVEIVGRGPKGFQYDLQFVGAEGGSEDDYINEVDGITVRIAARSVQYLDGSTLDFKETLMGGGFSFENPNPMWVDELSQKVAAVSYTHLRAHETG